jgi:hypothetical protein
MPLALQFLGSSGAVWVKIVGSLISIRSRPLTYAACSLPRDGRTCNKKLVPNSDGSDLMYCDTCQQECTPVYRYLLSMGFADFEGVRENVAAFGEAGDEVMKMTAEQAHQVPLPP